jgi:hypothetical protein
MKNLKLALVAWLTPHQRPLSFFVFATSLLSQPLTFADPQYNRGCDGAVECRGNSGQQPYEQNSNDTSRSRGYEPGLSDQATYQLIQQTESIITDILESNERDRIANERFIDEQLKLEKERQVEHDKQRALEEERERKDLVDRKTKYKNSLSDKSNNPWSTDAPKLDKNGGSPQPPSSQSGQPTQVSVKDPSQDYSGKPCEYFTKKSDDAHLYYHRDGATVAYGKNIYVCDAGWWRFRTTTDRYWAPVRNIEASKLEN